MRPDAFLSAVCLLGAAVISPAAAAAVVQKRGTFKVDRVRNSKFVGHNGPRALLRAYRKYGVFVPDSLVAAADSTSQRLAADGPVDRSAGLLATLRPPSGHKSNNSKSNNSKSNSKSDSGKNTSKSQPTNNNTGIVAATPEPQDTEFLSPITVAGQTLLIDFDTGSSDLWVFTTGLPQRSQAGHGVYDPAASDTFRQLGESTFSISYGDDSGAAGLVGLDRVDVGGVSVPDQAVGLATELSSSFVQDTSSDGLMGLAFSALNTVQPQRQKTFFDNVMPSLALPVFSADLRPAAVGAYEFGRIDGTKFVGDMAWIPVNTTGGFWQFSSETFAVGGDGDGDGAPPQPRTGTPGGQAIADTGTTLILASAETVSGYYGEVPGAVDSEADGGVVVPCDQQLPDLMLDVGGMYMARVRGEDINFAPSPSGESNMCFGGLQKGPADIQIFGDIFFKSQFVVFNGGNQSLGMAEHK